MIASAIKENSTQRVGNHHPSHTREARNKRVRNWFLAVVVVRAHCFVLVQTSRHCSRSVYVSKIKKTKTSHLFLSSFFFDVLVLALCCVVYAALRRLLLELDALCV